MSEVNHRRNGRKYGGRSRRPREFLVKVETEYLGWEGEGVRGRRGRKFLKRLWNKRIRRNARRKARVSICTEVHILLSLPNYGNRQWSYL